MFIALQMIGDIVRVRYVTTLTDSGKVGSIFI